MVGVKFANLLVKNINKTVSVLSPIRYLFPCTLFCYGRLYLLSWTSSLYLHIISFIIADLAKHGTDMSGKQTTQTTFSISGKPKDDDYYQSKSANLFKSCIGLRFSGLQDYDTFLARKILQHPEHFWFLASKWRTTDKRICLWSADSAIMTVSFALPLVTRSHLLRPSKLKLNIRVQIYLRFWKPNLVPPQKPINWLCRKRNCTLLFFQAT